MASPSTPLERALSLTRPAARRVEGAFLAEGPHVVADALDAGAAVHALFVGLDRAGDPATEALVRRAVDAGVRIHRISARQMVRLSDTETPQGIVAVVGLAAAPAEPFADAAPWLLLDGIQDPGNVGTLLRSAEAFGARGVVAGAGTADLWGGKVVRAAQGAHFRLVLLADDAVRAAESFRRAGGEVWAATQGGDDVYSAPPAPERVLLALGSEARGLSDGVLALAARRVAVPQRGRAESLNVAMAGSVLLSWLTRAPAPARRRPR